MIKNYILTLGVAGVALGSYAVYAGNSATMTVTATIAHDVSLVVKDDLDYGIITIDPSVNSGGYTSIAFNGSLYGKGGGIISIEGNNVGYFTATVSDECKKNGDAYSSSHGSCFSVSHDSITMGGIKFSDPYVDYVSGNEFKFLYDYIEYKSGTIPTPGDYEQDITIEYVL